MKLYLEKHYKKLAYADIIFGGLFLLFGSIGFIFLLSEGSLPPSSMFDVILGIVFGSLNIATGYSLVRFGFEGKREFLGWVNMVLGSFIAIDALGSIFVSSSEIPKYLMIFGSLISVVAAFSLVLGGYYLKSYEP